MKINRQLGLVLAALSVSWAAHATVYSGGTLTSWSAYSNNGSGNATLTGTVLTGWTYNDVTGTLTAPGQMQGLFEVGATPLYTNTIVGGVFSTTGGPANATSFTCTEGLFGGLVGDSICGNYNFGANLDNESTTAWGPGLLYSRTIGGDDFAIGPQQNLHGFFDGTTLISFSGGTLVIGNTNANGNLRLATSGNSFTVTGLTTTPTPQAVVDVASTKFNTPVQIPVLANDFGFSDPATVSISTPPANGTAVVAGSPGPQAGIAVTYTPATGFSGTDTFYYQVTDGVSTGSAQVSVNVAAFVAPAANNDSASTHLATPVTVNVLANDVGFNDPATVSIATSPAHGTAVITGSPGPQAGISITYTPSAGFTGSDSFSYQVTDGTSTGTAAVAITVLNFKANNDSYVELLGSCCADLYVAANDIGFSDPVTVTIVSPPNKGGSAYVESYANTKAGTYISYYPNTYANSGNFTEQLTYRISDGIHTDTAVVTLKNVAYIAQDDSATTNVGDPVTINVGANDLGFRYPATAGVYVAAMHGNVVINNSPGSASYITISYNPDPGFQGADTFQYAMDDGMHIGIATVTVNVINDADHDGVDDSVDNCLGVYNPDQRDSNGDGYGNACDADLNHDGIVNFQDLVLFHQRFGTADPDADFDGNGIVNFTDLAKFRNLFGKPPGPSGLHPTCPPSCP